MKDVAQWYSAHEPKGEIVIIVEGAPAREKVKEKDRWKEKDVEKTGSVG